MRVGDVSPKRQVFVAPNGGRAHLYPGCHHLRGSDAARLQCGMLNPAAEVCPQCAKRYERHADPRDGMAAMLSDPDFGPVDLGLSNLGERGP